MIHAIQNTHNYNGDFIVKEDTEERSRLKEITTLSEKSGLIIMDFDQRVSINNMQLSPGSEKLKTTSNLGGSSLPSEVLSFEVLYRCFGAELIETETEIKYKVQGKATTDFVVSIFGLSIAVSVTRAVKFNSMKKIKTYTNKDAKKLLERKLKGINTSSDNQSVDDKDPWYKQVLYIWARTPDIANLLRSAYQDNTLGEEIKSSTVVLVVVASNDISKQVFSCSKPIDNRRVKDNIPRLTRSISCSCDNTETSELPSRPPPKIKRLISASDANNIVFCEHHSSTQMMN